MAEERRRLKELQEANKAIQKEIHAEDSKEDEALILEKEKSFELPEELKEYRGDPTDADGKEDFLKKQQTARRKLEKERVRWLADQVRAKRAEKSRIEKMKSEEDQLQREKEKAKEALMIAQEVFHEKIEKLKLRREPLGLDRYNRRYWWGLGGNKSSLYIEDVDGKWAQITSLSTFHEILESLDSRGVRENELLAVLSKYSDSISNQMKHLNEHKRDIIESQKVPMRHSAREFRQVEFFDPSKEAAQGARLSRRASKNSPRAIRNQLSSLQIPSSTIISLSEVVSILLHLKDGINTLEISGPSGDESWDLWADQVRSLGQSKCSLKDITVAGTLNVLKKKALEMESILNKQSYFLQGRITLSEHEDSEGEGNSSSNSLKEESSIALSNDINISQIQETIDSSFSPRKTPRESKFLWQTLRERTAWIQDTSSVTTAARLAYCANILKLQAEPVFRYMRKV